MQCKKCFGRGIVWVGQVTVAMSTDFPPKMAYYGLADTQEKPCDLCGGSGGEEAADLPLTIGEND